MKAARLLTAATVLMLTTACAAQMVSDPSMASGSPYAPVNEASRGGVIKYLNQGARFVVEKRREDAYKQMHEACGGPYHIDAEGPRAEGGVVVAISPTAAGSFGSQYWYIQFSCVREPEAAARDTTG